MTVTAKVEDMTGEIIHLDLSTFPQLFDGLTFSDSSRLLNNYLVNLSLTVHSLKLDYSGSETLIKCAPRESRVETNDHDNHFPDLAQFRPAPNRPQPNQSSKLASTSTYVERGILYSINC